MASKSKHRGDFLIPSGPPSVRRRIADSSSLQPAPKDCLTNLPAEILLQVLGRLPDFGSLLSAITACKNLYEVYEGNHRLTLLAIFQQQYDEAKQYEIGRLFWELVFAIRHPNAFKRETVEELFIIGWEHVRGIHLEELLLPLGRELASSYHKGGLTKEAVGLLRKIGYGHAPFDRSPPIDFGAEEADHNYDQRWPRMTLLPILELLTILSKEEHLCALRSHGSEWSVPDTFPLSLAEIEGGEPRVFFSVLPGVRSMSGLLRTGIVFDGGRAYLGIVSSGRIPVTDDRVKVWSLLKSWQAAGRMKPPARGHF